MKKVLSIIGGMLTACAAWAVEPIDVIPFAVAVSTNAAADTVITNKLSGGGGHVSAIILDFAGTASPTCTVLIATAPASGTGAARTILSKTAVAGDQVFYPRGIVDTTAGVDIANTPADIPVTGSITATMYAANRTGITCTAYIVIK